MSFFLWVCVKIKSTLPHTLYMSPCLSACLSFRQYVSHMSKTKPKPNISSLEWKVKNSPIIYLDEHLSFEAHTTHIINKLTRSLYCIKQAKHLIPPNGMKSLYLVLIHSHLTHGTLIMNSITAKNKQRIFKIQKKAIRIITGSSCYAHTAPLFNTKSYLMKSLLLSLSWCSCTPLKITTLPARL